MRDLARHSGDYLSALRNLQSLTLFNITVEHISEAQFRTCFSAFRETLTHLFLNSFVMSFSAFVTLVDYFPNIATLELRGFELKRDKAPVPPLSRPLRGRLHLHAVQPHCLEFFDLFAQLDLEYEELVIGSRPIGTEFLRSVLQTSTGTVKILRITAELRREQPLLALLIKTASLLTPHVQAGPAAMIHSFRRLQELELVVTWSSISHHIFSSITSVELRKIIFPVRYIKDWTIFIRDTEARAYVDEKLCELVDRLRGAGYRHTLEVELRLRDIGDDPGRYDFSMFLPEFREKGVVTITDASHGDQLLHSSIHSR